MQETFDALAKIPAVKKHLSTRGIFYIINVGRMIGLLNVALLLIALAAFAVIYKNAPNRKVFVYFCFALGLMFCVGALVGMQTYSVPSIDDEQRAELLRQEQFFIDWYSQYQRDIEQLDHNWQLYHSIVENYNEYKADLSDTYMRLQELERAVLSEQIRIHTMQPPDGLDEQCGELVGSVIRKTQLYVDAQIRTITLTKEAANPNVIEDHDALTRRFNDIMIRESPVGLFTAVEISALRDYFTVDD